MSKRVALESAFLRIVAFLVLAASMLGIFFLWSHAPTESSFYPKCSFHAVTGLFCPGCGGTRSIWYLIHGDAIGALRQNFLILVVGLPLLLIYGFALGKLAILGRWCPPKIGNAKMGWIFVGLVLAFWIIRNLPFESLDFLRPSSVGVDSSK